MIVQTEIGGRKASVCYLNSDFQPVEQDDATLAKIVFEDDNDCWFVQCTPKEPPHGEA